MLRCSLTATPSGRRPASRWLAAVEIGASSDYGYGAPLAARRVDRMASTTAFARVPDRRRGGPPVTAPRQGRRGASDDPARLSRRGYAKGQRARYAGAVANCEQVGSTCARTTRPRSPSTRRSATASTTPSRSALRGAVARAGIASSPNSDCSPGVPGRARHANRSPSDHPYRQSARGRRRPAARPRCNRPGSPLRVDEHRWASEEMQSCADRQRFARIDRSRRPHRCRPTSTARRPN